MPQFNDFTKKHGPPMACRLASASALQTYQKKLPAQLLDEWRESGWCAYGGGLLWIVSPEELADPVTLWLGVENDAVPFARSAFGHIFLWDGDAAHMLDPQYGTLARIVNNIEVFFDYVLCRNQYLDDVLDRKLYLKAKKKLGPLEYDDCYGFEPAIALGGPGTLDTLRKVKLKEHLAILAQLSDELQII